MDDRRRTISSEEQMIGEALMRVSNTLEAQRLTKSLDYQEKLRRRSNIRLIIAIVCLFVALMMVVIGGATLFILWRYADPILDTVVPFLKGMFGDFGIIWDGLVESATYVPVMVEQLTRILESLCVMLEGISKMDLSGMMRYLTNILGTTSGMLSDLRSAMGSMMPMLSAMGNALTKMLNGDVTALNSILSGMGIDMDVVSNMMRNMISMLNDLSASGADMMKGVSQTMGIVTEEMGKALESGEIQAATEQFFDKVPGLIDGSASLIEGMGNGMQAVGENIDSEQVGQITQDGISAMGKLVEAMDGMASGLAAIGDLLGRFGGN
ncbi:MAG: hypothetical protein PUD72_01925 [Oscillospiraceae bacterium]|nr:hypothetical protein [Oscillospiraceae bacterium]